MIIRRAASLFLALAIVSPAFAETPIGFRTDGTGRYRDAQPPLVWGPDKNVVWKIPLSQSNAIPVILGDKLFTCADPCVLLCVNKVDGKVLWRHESFFKEIEPTDNGHTLVLEPGREYKEVAHNSLETFRSSLVFAGKRLYVRTIKGLWCIGE